MKKTCYTEYNGTETVWLPDHGKIDKYKTSKVTIIWPQKIEKFYRYMRIYFPTCKYILDWNPLRTPSFGIWLEFNDDFTTVKVRSRTAHYLHDGQLDVTFAIDTRWQLRFAVNQINNICTWYDQCKTPQKR